MSTSLLKGKLADYAVQLRDAFDELFKRTDQMISAVEREQAKK